MDNKVSTSIDLEIYTPENSFFSKGVYMVLMPGVHGEFGVSTGHMALLVGLKVGLVTVYDSNMQVANKLIIGKGFTEIINDNIVIFTEKLLHLSSCDEDELLLETETLNNNLLSCKDINQELVIKDKIEFNKMVLELLKHETLFKK